MSVSRTYEEKTAAIIENLFGEKEVVGEAAVCEPDSTESKIINNLAPKSEPTDTHYTKNYGENGGDKWIVNGTLEVTGEIITPEDPDEEQPDTNEETG